MKRLAILLIHGFSGSCRDLLPIVDRLEEAFGPDSVQLVQLHGHDGYGPTCRF